MPQWLFKFHAFTATQSVTIMPMWLAEEDECDRTRSTCVTYSILINHVLDCGSVSFVDFALRPMTFLIFVICALLYPACISGQKRANYGTWNYATLSILLSARFGPVTRLALKVINMALKETAEISTPVRSVCILLSYPAIVQSYCHAAFGDYCCG